MTQRMIIISLLALLAFLPVRGWSEFAAKTGKFKVHQDRCYEQEQGLTSEKLHWIEFNCNTYLERAAINADLFAVLTLYSNEFLERRLSKEQYLEIVREVMLAHGTSAYDIKCRAFQEYA